MTGTQLTGPKFSLGCLPKSSYLELSVSPGFASRLTLAFSRRGPTVSFRIRSEPFVGRGQLKAKVYARHGRECGGASPL